MSDYLKSKVLRAMPRLPLKGSIDLTYRCNFDCRHCWLRIPPGAPETQDELSFDEIRRVVDEARAMGTRQWSISGGEPMLRPDFADIFDYVTRTSVSYFLNTNGSLITPEIAQLLRRKGVKMVALYGATAEVFDHVTRAPGTFERTMRGFAYLKEAGAGFTVQLIPMRDNYHQWDEMQALAQSLSKHWRVGAAWLYLSAGGDPERNREIKRQRLAPREVIELDMPDLSYAEAMEAAGCHGARPELCRRDGDVQGDDRLFASCIAGRRDFHVDPYGRMSFCSFIKEPALRYDLRQGSLQQCWDEFIPSLADQVRGGQEYLENCAACELRGECRYCPVYGYLEHRRFPARVGYLCAVAQENRRFKDNWRRNHRRYYQIAGITVQVDSDLPITEATFRPKFELFQAVRQGSPQAGGPGEDTIRIRHHFALPDLNGQDLGEEIYCKPPWAIYRKGDSWVYVGISPNGADDRPHRVAVFNQDHTRGRIYHPDEEIYLKGNLNSLTLLPSDQILLSRVLADRQGCYLHSSGAVLNGQGLLFVGHSEAGKSTMMKLLQDPKGLGKPLGSVELLCDDRNIVRKWDGAQDLTGFQNLSGLHGWRVHGTWSHGELPIVSNSSAPLRAILFLEKAPENRLIPLDDRREIMHRLLACLIKPLETPDWWQKMLALVEQMAQEVPCYVLRFDKSGGVVEVLERLTEYDIESGG